jgi:prolyl-tRNA synthetase
MSHSDDNGLVIPPRLAHLPVVFVPIWRSDEERDLVLGRAREITRDWDPLFYKIDDRETIKPGRKFAEWEVKGVPIRIEIGPRDCQNNEVVVVRRDTSAKTPMPMDGLREKLEALLETIQSEMLFRARERMAANTRDCDDFDEYKKYVTQGGFFRIHWCGANACEQRLQADTKSTIRCIPFDAKEEAGKCMVCGQPSQRRVIAAQSY